MGKPLMTAYRMDDEIIVSFGDLGGWRVTKVEDDAGTVYRRWNLTNVEVWVGQSNAYRAGQGIRWEMDAPPARNTL